MLDNFMAAGYKMRVYDVNASAMQEATAKGADGAVTPRLTEASGYDGDPPLERAATRSAGHASQYDCISH